MSRNSRPDFDLHEVLSGKWALLFSHPEDFETADASAKQHRALKRRGVVRYSAPGTAVTMADLLARIAGLRERQLAKAA